MSKRQPKEGRECPVACRFCEHAALLDRGSQILCKYSGIVPHDHTCRKFRYDPLKRIPAPPLRPPKLCEDDLLL